MLEHQMPRKRFQSSVETVLHLFVSLQESIRFNEGEESLCKPCGVCVAHLILDNFKGRLV